LQKTNTRLLSIFLAVIMVFGLLPITVWAEEGGYSYSYNYYGTAANGAIVTSPAALTITPFSVGDVTVIVSIEGYSVGHGFYIEPFEVTVPADSSVMNATISALAANSLTHDGGTAGINRINGLNAGVATPPCFIMDVINELDGTEQWGTVFTFTPQGSPGGSLGNNDYFTFSGFMFTVNHIMPMVGAGEVPLNDGDVIRWQFSLLMGDDLGFGWGEPLYTHADKTNLIRGLFTPGITAAAEQAALGVIIDPLATSTEVSAALADILSGQTPQAANTSGLTSAISEANALQQQAFTPASWTVLQSALNSAQAVSANIFATQEAVNRATSSLQAAIALLEAVTPTTPAWQQAMDGALGWLAANAPSPTVGDEWAVIAVARANIAADSWFESYLSNLENEVNGLSSWTDFQRVTLALTALGVDASNFNGNDLLSDFRNFTPSASRPPHSQGVNADIFALIVLNSRPYTGAQQEYVQSILAAQTPSGAWAWGTWASADITAMAIQALAPYYNNDADVTAAINNGFSWIATETLGSAEDFAQVIIARTAIGLSAEDYVAGLLAFYDESTGGFISPWTGSVNAISTEQAAYALVAHYRHENGTNKLFDMRDAGTGTGTGTPGTGTGTPGTGTGTPATGRVFISVRNDNPGPGGTRIFFEGYFDINAGETAYTLLRRTGLAIGARGMYVFSINGLAEFHYGAGSGWMYRVNGVFPVMAASDFALRNNDRVEWLFTRDIGHDVGGGGSFANSPATGLPPITLADDDEYDDEEEDETEITDDVAVADAENEHGTGTNLPEANEIFVNPFTDISESDWFYPYVNFMYERGLMTGVAQGVFAPEINFSRAMAVHILWRLDARPSAQGMNFDDVAHGNWYSDAVAWARANGIVQGFADGTFQPNAHITREHFAVILRNYAQRREIEIAPAILNALVGNDTLTRAEAAEIFRILLEN
jgi:hypothetical protein